MGYTHYWEQTDRPDDATWKTIRKDVHDIIKASDVSVVGYTRTTSSLPGPSGGAIFFNPVPDMKGESFRLAQDGSEHGFCKTNEQPYDEIVAGIICYLESVTGLYKARNRDPEDYEVGLDLARRALPQHAEILRAPAFDMND